MTISDAGVAFICSFEGFSAAPYPDPGTKGAPYTIGYGTTVYPSGVHVTIADVHITKQQGMEYIRHHITTHIAPWLDTNLPTLIQAEYDSVSSFIYNCGLGNFQSSTLLKDIRKNAPCETITKDLMMWNKAAGKVLLGLTRRRNAEATLFCTGSYGSI